MQRRISQRGGFTLVELLVAVGITVVIVVLLGTMLTSLMGTASRANQRTDAFREARAALQMISRDFSNIVRTQWQPDPFANPALPGPFQPRTRPLAYLALKNMYADPVTTNQQLFGLVATKNTGSGDVCSVGYYCSWDGKAYSLRRFFRDSAATYTAITSSSAYIQDATLFTPVATGATADDLLAQYVWNMRIVAYDAAGTALAYPYECDTSATTPVQPPASIEISFSAISPQAARTVISVTTSPTDWTDTNSSNYQRLIKPHVYQFHTRVEL